MKSCKPFRPLCRNSQRNLLLHCRRRSNRNARSGVSRRRERPLIGRDDWVRDRSRPRRRRKQFVIVGAALSGRPRAETQCGNQGRPRGPPLQLQRWRIMFTLIEQGEVFGPEPLGKTSVLLNGGSILKIGEINASTVEQLGIPLDVIDASNCIVTPGLIDPHQHLLGGSGEEGFSSQTPEISASEVISAGITTVVGCLGVDTTMKTMAGLLARAKALKEEG